MDWSHLAQRLPSKAVTEGKIQGRIKRGSRRKQLLHDLKEKRRYGNFKAEALNRTLWRSRIGIDYGRGARQTKQQKSSSHFCMIRACLYTRCVLLCVAFYGNQRGDLKEIEHVGGRKCLVDGITILQCLLKIVQPLIYQAQLVNVVYQAGVLGGPHGFF